MAEQNKKNINPSVGFYGEPGFVSLTTSLRKLSGDDTLPTDNYIDIYKNIYDLITPDEQHVKGGVIDVSLTKDKKELVIFYANDSIKNLPLEDNYLFQVYYDNISRLVYFVLTNGTKVTLDINFLYEQFATKEDVEEIQEEILEIKDDVVDIKENIEDIGDVIIELKEDITNITNIIEEGVDIKWKNF